jgi:hypothetical protein
VTLSANLVGAAIKRSGRYDYRIGGLDHTTCRLKFYEQGREIGESMFSLDDAKKAGLTASDTYTKYVRNMLFSRALTNGARWYCPDVFNGPIYTPDELGAQVDLETGEVLEFVPIRDQAPEEDEPTIRSADDPDWQKWLVVQGEGLKYGVVIPRVGLPIRRSQLAEAGNGVFRATHVRQKKLAQVTARSSVAQPAARSVAGDPPVPRLSAASRCGRCSGSSSPAWSRRPRGSRSRSTTARSSFPRTRSRSSAPSSGCRIGIKTRRTSLRDWPSARLTLTRRRRSHDRRAYRATARGDLGPLSNDAASHL